MTPHGVAEWHLWQADLARTAWRTGCDDPNCMTCALERAWEHYCTRIAVLFYVFRALEPPA
jgi:hypothetical protein